ncbi:hypothetical protein CSUI_005042 [Cystoisospora suis]|uniref:Uncharacterized protein n=1 Tax=Cystoisospora suis TaxID=483139 RepID=A0A2C6KZD6_9APIC|nr:hypothetical protein CSUI_005042 [Cystoisospora suis]
MASVIEARAHYNALEQCKRRRSGDTQAKGQEDCLAVKGRALQAGADVMTRECGMYEDAFFQCYRHNFRLDGCNDERTTLQLLQCQKSVARRVFNL